MGFTWSDDDDPWTKCQAKPSQHFSYKVAKKGEEKRNLCIVATVCKFEIEYKAAFGVYNFFFTLPILL